MDAVTLHHGDALDVLRGMADNSVDAVVTDPPSGIGFMGKTWDHDHGGREGWVKAFAAIFAECLRVVKPGGHAFVWALPRTSHWTACALEDAGWEVREKVYHLFGSGFPKSLDVGKAIDKAAGAEREVVGPPTRHTGQSYQWAGTVRHPTHSESKASLTAPATDAARQWDGWGTALKPAAEEWILARKPLVGTVAANVQQWGTGGLNIEACRVGTGQSNAHLHGQRPLSILPSNTDDGGVTWDEGESLCAMCAGRVAESAKHTTPGTRASIATSSVGPTTNARVSRLRDGTSRAAIGCYAGRSQAEQEQSLTVDGSLSTSRYGKTTTVPSLPDMSSTTSTETSKTTGLTTCKQCGAVNIPVCTASSPPSIPAAEVKPNTQGDGASDTPNTKHGTPSLNGSGGSGGRWPSNLVLSHAPGCQRVGTRRVRGGNGVRGSDAGNTMYGGGKGMNRPTTGQTVGYADADGLETVDDWRCVDGCAVRALGEQSGVSESKRSMRGLTGRHDPGQGAEHNRIKPYSDGERGHADTGTAARFFSTFEPSPLDDVTPFLYTAKASRREREAGLEGMEERTKRILNGGIPSAVNSDPRGMSGGGDRQARNHHPTVKSLSLMKWLVRLITPPGGVVLDCFLGSGTTGMAATMEGFNFVGIEQDAEYIEIARRRIAWAQEQQPPLLRATGD
jgi:DNA modification methylase